MKKSYWVYVLSSDKNGTLYVGVTNDLAHRVYEHKSKIIQGFTSKHGVNRLVYVEEFFDITEAICREKSIKRWKR